MLIIYRLGRLTVERWFDGKRSGNRADDRWNNTRVEYAMLRLARECGLVTGESRIETAGGKDVLLFKRFDREKIDKGYARARMVSGLTILRSDEAPEARQNWSYITMVEEMRRIVDPKDPPAIARPNARLPSRAVFGTAFARTAI